MELLPDATKAVDMRADALGTWLFHCSVNDHLHAGMELLYTVAGASAASAAAAVASFTSAGRRREYWVAAQEVQWDYAAGGNKCPTSGAVPSGYVTAAHERLGSRYKKVRYLQYTDASYSTRAKEDATLGLLGPSTASSLVIPTPRVPS